MVDISYGIIGVLLILLGWIPETYKVIKEKRPIHPIFAFLYTSGSAFLTYHALLLNDVPFIILNVAATLIAIINLYFFFAYKN
jgi:uncharacterized protein with PQ loop repeat